MKNKSYLIQFFYVDYIYMLGYRCIYACAWVWVCSKRRINTNMHKIVNILKYSYFTYSF